MSRLITEDAVYEYLTDKFNEYDISIENEFVGKILDELGDIPTAYDVEKVVEELACNSRFIDDINEHNIKCISCVVDQETAIDIVRKGGVNEPNI